MSNILPAKTAGEAAQEAKNIINLERSGTITGLHCRFPRINMAMLKYYRFASNQVIAGMSGSGKSAFLNITEQDFVNPIINSTFVRQGMMPLNEAEDGVLVLAFKYEMAASDEILRTLSGQMKVSYSYLLSADYKYEDATKTKGSYNKVSDQEFEMMENALKRFEDLPILYFETAGNLNQMYSTIKFYRDKYPHKKIVVTLDHTLLSIKMDEKDDLELIARTARMGVKLKKEIGSMNIWVSQLNGEIEKLPRKENAAFHFPVKGDIHGSNQLFWACDTVAIWHRPAQLGIGKYGAKEFPTQLVTPDGGTRDLVHYGIIKGRKNKTGNIWLLERFAEGYIEETRPIVVPNKPTVFG